MPRHTLCDAFGLGRTILRSTKLDCLLCYGVSGVNQERQAYFQKRLSAWREELEDRLRKAARGEQNSSDSLEADVADQAARSYEKELSLLNAMQQKDRLRLIQQALRRISTGEYGRCAACSGEINPKRLEAIPWAQYCIACQQTVERADSMMFPS